MGEDPVLPLLGAVAHYRLGVVRRVRVGHLVDDETARPEVVAAARFSYTPVTPEPLVPGVDGGGFAAVDEGFLADVYRPAILEGRAPTRGKVRLTGIGLTST